MQCQPEIIVIRVQRGERRCFVFDPLCVGAFSNPEIMHEMSLPCVFLFASFSETFGAVPPQRFEQTITQAFLARLLHGNQRFGHQLFEMIQRIGVRPERLHGSKIKTAGEN